MSQFDPLPSAEDLPLDHKPTLLDEHDAELNYANVLLWLSLTNSSTSHESAKENVTQGEKQYSKIIQARGLELKTELQHFSECSSTKRNG